jgi:hypothetical protein
MKSKGIVGTFVVLGSVFLMSASAGAQATRTWVSGVGDDANPCSRTAPCKTFAGAISKTATGGEICVLDPGGFGALTITKPITIRNDGIGTAGVLVSGTNGFVIAVPNATDNVIIRGLDFEGLGTGLNGILVNTGGNVFIEDSTINNFTISGISFTPSVAGSRLHVTNTLVRNNGNFGASSGQGILFQPTGAGSGEFTGVQTNRNVAGMKVLGGTVSVTESVAEANAFAGFATGAGAILNLEKSVSTHNGTGVNCGAGTVRIGNMSITDNGTDFTSGGTCITFHNNDIGTASVAGLTVANPQ